MTPPTADITEHLRWRGIPERRESTDHFSEPEPAVVRTRERAAVAAVIAGLTSAAHVEITGEPGIGKTRLLAEIATIARAHGHIVLSGRAVGSTGDAEFDAFADAIDHRHAGLAANALPPHVCRTLAEIFPSFPPAAAGTAPAGRAGVRPGHAVRLLLETIATIRPVVLTLDDLQLADARSVDLICHLLRSPARAPVLLVSAYRTRQASARLRHAFASAPALLRLPLQPLSVAQVRRLAGDSISPAQCHALHRDSLGNPLYLQALLDPKEHGVDAEVLAELDELSPHAHLAADAGTVLGDAFGLPDVAVVAELSEATSYSAIDELVAADLVRELPEPGRFAFRHPVVRQAIYRNTRPGWRLGAQARAELTREVASPHSPEPLARLTRRERQIAMLVGEGMTNREIAAELFVTAKTVEMHLSNVFTKLEVRNRVGVARKLQAGLA